jgi:hypothetical protein
MLKSLLSQLILLGGVFCQSNLTVYELIASNADLTIFNSLLATTPEIKKGIASPVFTIFAPTNDAFKELNATNPALLKELQSNHGELVKVFQCRLSVVLSVLQGASLIIQIIHFGT